METSQNTAKLTAAGLFVILIPAVLLIWALPKNEVLAANIEKPDPKRILAIFLFKQGLPWAYRIEESMRIALASNSAFPKELNVEHADLSRYPQDTYIPKVMELFKYKYSRREMDVVIAVGDESTNLLMKHGAGLFGDIPAVFITIDRQDLPKEIIKPLMRSLLWGWDFMKTINIIENSLPQSKHLFIGPACLILDVKMPGLNGLELQNQLQQMEYVMPIVFITGHGDIPMSVKAMKKGAVDFLIKPFDDEDLLKAVQEALKKDIVYRGEMNEKQRILQRIKSLTPREYEILTFVISGMLNKQTAYELNISEKTVKAHRGRVMVKLGVDSLAELVRLAEKAGIEPVHETKS